MNKEMMNYTIKVDNKVIDTGSIIGVGESVYEITEDVSSKLVAKIGVYGLDVEFVDTSKVWTFEGRKDDHSYVIEFKPAAIDADKYSVNDDVA